MTWALNSLLSNSGSLITDSLHCLSYSFLGAQGEN